MNEQRPRPRTDAELGNLFQLRIDDAGAGRGRVQPGHGVPAHLDHRRRIDGPQLVDRPLHRVPGFLGHQARQLDMIDVEPRGQHVREQQLGRVLDAHLRLPWRSGGRDHAAVNDRVAARGDHLLEQHDRGAGPRGLVGGGQPGEAAADDDHVELL
ncbi:MAG: hypothetical protein WBA88_25865, partial [Pseudaminobacter sp.]